MAAALGVSMAKLTLCKVGYTADTRDEKAERESFFMASGGSEVSAAGDGNAGFGYAGQKSLNQIRHEEVSSQHAEFFVPVLTVNVDCLFEIKS